MFADVRLPCLMDGVDLARTVRLQWPWIRTVLTSGAPLALDDRLNIPRGVRFIPKPWGSLEVLMEAERAVRGGPGRSARSIGAGAVDGPDR